MNGPNYERLFWQQRELEKTLASLRPPSIGIIPPDSLVAQIHALTTLSERFTFPPPYLKAYDDIQKALLVPPSLGESIDKLASVTRSVADTFAAIESAMSRMTTTVPRLEIDTSFAIRDMAESLVSPQALFRIGRMPADLMDVALRPHVAFETFASVQLKMAEAASQAMRSNTLSVIAEAADLLSRMTRGPELASLVALPTPELRTLPDVNVFTLLRADLAKVNLDSEQPKLRESIAGATPGKVVNLGTRLLELVYNLNVEAEREGRDTVFKPTNKAMRAFHIVSTRVATDELSFGEVIDNLYCLLYEGSGDAKRLVDRVPDEQLVALWHLKLLRLGLRHDVDHGSKSAAREKAQKIGAAYQALVGRSAPRAEQEWSLAQVALYQGLVDLLDALWRG